MDTSQSPLGLENVVECTKVGTVVDKGAEPNAAAWGEIYQCVDNPGNYVGCDVPLELASIAKFRHGLS